MLVESLTTTNVYMDHTFTWMPYTLAPAISELRLVSNTNFSRLFIANGEVSGHGPEEFRHLVFLALAGPPTFPHSASFNVVVRGTETETSGKLQLYITAITEYSADLVIME